MRTKINLSDDQLKAIEDIAKAGTWNQVTREVSMAINFAKKTTGRNICPCNKEATIANIKLALKLHKQTENESTDTGLEESSTKAKTKSKRKSSKSGLSPVESSDGDSGNSAK